MNYYVYYKIELSRLEQVRSAVETLFLEIQRECGVQGRWMRRRDDPATYMEVYEGIVDAKAFEDALSRHTKSFPYPRKVECFQCA